MTTIEPPEEEVCGLECEDEPEPEPFVPIAWKAGEKPVTTCGKNVPEKLLRHLARLNLPVGVHTLRGDLVEREKLPSPWMCAVDQRGYPGLMVEVDESAIHIYESHVAGEAGRHTGGAMASCMSSDEITKHLAWILEAHDRKAMASFALFPEELD
jgi:hypothetical protein